MSSDQEPITETMHRWCDGDQSALEPLLREELPRIRRLVMAGLGEGMAGRVEADDLVQEVMLDILRYGPRFRAANRAQFHALVGRIAANVIRDEHRWQSARCRGFSQERPLPPSSVLRLDPSVVTPERPAGAASRDEQQGWIRIALEFLEPEDRRVILLRDWEELQFEEIGERMGLAANAARMRYNRALPRLAERVLDLQRGRVDRLLRAGSSD
jgi:RNA polymerase sigma-70 factor (ECF subfamily)